jgi:transposase
MARITRAAAHVSAEVAKRYMKTTKTAMYRQRWLIVYTALVASRKAEGIAKQCGAPIATVHAMISTYNRLGIEAVETVGKGDRHHELLTGEQERELLTPFLRERSRARLPLLLGRQGEAEETLLIATETASARARQSARARKVGAECEDVGVQHVGISREHPQMPLARTARPHPRYRNRSPVSVL